MSLIGNNPSGTNGHSNAENSQVEGISPALVNTRAMFDSATPPGDVTAAAAAATAEVFAAAAPAAGFPHHYIPSEVPGTAVLLQQIDNASGSGSFVQGGCGAATTRSGVSFAPSATRITRRPMPVPQQQPPLPPQQQHQQPAEGDQNVSPDHVLLSPAAGDLTERLVASVSDLSLSATSSPGTPRAASVAPASTPSPGGGAGEVDEATQRASKKRRGRSNIMGRSCTDMPAVATGTAASAPATPDAVRVTRSGDAAKNYRYRTRDSTFAIASLARITAGYILPGQTLLVPVKPTQALEQAKQVLRETNAELERRYRPPRALPLAAAPGDAWATSSAADATAATSSTASTAAFDGAVAMAVSSSPLPQQEQQQHADADRARYHSILNLAMDMGPASFAAIQQVLDDFMFVHGLV